METTENVNTVEPINNNTTDNQIDNQETKPTPELKVTPVPVQEQAPVAESVQPDSETPEVNAASENKPVDNTKLAPGDAHATEIDDSISSISNEDQQSLDDEKSKLGDNDGVIQSDGKKITIDGPTFISQMFSENPGEVSKFFNMSPKELKKEQEKMKRKGKTMDSKYANLFLLQSIRDECGILVFACLASWLLTRIGFSIYWTFGIMGATLLAYINYNNKQKHLYYNKERKAYNQKVKLNPDNPETINWLNYILQKAWPTAEPLIGGIVMDSVNGVLDDIITNVGLNNLGFDAIKITEFSLGTEAPKLMEMCPSTDTDPNVIKFTCTAKYEPLDTEKISKYDIESGEKRASNICLSIKPAIIPTYVPTKVTDILFVGKLLFVITTMETFPYVKKVEFTFVEQPNIKWELKPLGGMDVMSIPGLDAGIGKIIQMVISSIALEPTRITIDVEDMLKSMTLDQPIGLLKVNFYEGKELKNNSKIGTDDPYAQLSINGNILTKTNVIDNDLNPTWNHVEYVIVSGLIYSDPKNNSDIALIEAMTDNNLKKDSVMGRAEDLNLRHYIALCEYLRKKKIDEAREAAFIESIVKQGITDAREIRKIRKAEKQKRRDELLKKEKGKSFAQKLLDSLEKSAEDYISGLTELEKKEYINQWGNPLVDSDTIVPLYQLNKENKIDTTKPAGTIRMGINYIPLNQFNDNAEDNSADLFSETGIARIWIYKVTKLEKNPNSYCVADIDGKEVMRTNVRKYNNNPSFGAFKDVFVKNFSTAKLTVAVKNQETGSDSTLGTFSWDLYEIFERIKEDPAANWFKLSSKFEEAAINIGVEWKPLVIDISTSLQKPIGVCRLHLKGARNLKNKETFGTSDPYVKINLSGKEVGVTDIVDKDLNPEWNEVYYLMIRSKNDRLSFEVFDHDEVKNDSKLGKVEVNITDVCRNIKINGEQPLLSKAWENMNPLPEIKMKEHENIAVSVPLFENQSRNQVSKGRIEFDIKYFDFADIGFAEVEKEKEKEEEKIEDILASENTDRTFIDKVQASNLLSGILHVKVFSVKDLPKEAFFNVDVYLEDEPEHILLSSKKTTKPLKESNIEDIVEAFIRNYKTTKIVFAINERNGSSVKKITQYAVPVEQLLVGKTGFKNPFVHICEDNSTKIKLGIQYEPLDMSLQRSELSPQMGNLTVKIDQANVIAADHSGTSDPYVKVMLRGQEIKKTGVIKKTLNPIWNESFTVPIAERMNNKLVFEVYDWNQIGKDESIGQAEVPLYEVYDSEPINIKLPLYKPNKNNEKISCGDITLGLNFQPAIHNIRMHNRLSGNKLVGGVGTVVGGVGNVVGGVAGGVGNVVGGVAGGVVGGVGSIVGGVTRGIKKAGSKKDKNASGSSLKIKVISAEGLKAVDNGGTSDPYVKVQHQKNTFYKTKSIKKTLNPTWNEECSIPFEKDVSDPVIDFIIKDSNKFGKSVDIGFVEINLNEVLFKTDQITITKDFDVQNGPGKLTVQISYAEGVVSNVAPLESP
ncbi:hypothetical protein BCR36DRAFT_328417 [Piromyces finnis]|uniref:Tricalbin n=1 Tax=Piromyces finnis TaxID=1754191 RepID=A0A1Y1V8X9_9FUNG|nr:hypothetical protein BCR36DRAFT_328417 [Piromyces finnis]|eukprot:ORX49323.1 hypothetical protein BCR36DRAFT_328417 [Piromyces finnis]